MYSKPSRILIALAVLVNVAVVLAFVRPELVDEARSLAASLTEQFGSSTSPAPDEAPTEPVNEESSTTSRPRATTTTTSTSSTSTTTTSTTTTTTTTLPPTALEELVGRAMNDVPTVETITEYWVPMLSQKWNGLDYEGIVYGDEEILELDTYLREEYGAVLLWTGNYTSFFRSDMWVHIVPEAYYDKEGALAWCVASGRSRADCGAKILSRTRGTKGTTAWLP